jgi:hypothetical protein
MDSAQNASPLRAPAEPASCANAKRWLVEPVFDYLGFESTLLKQKTRH